MKQILIIVVAFVEICLANHIQNANTRIIGGKDVQIGQYPFMVNLRRNKTAYCGGSIINKRFVLTAAHCMVNQPINLVKIHAVTISKLEDGEIYEPEKFILHENFVDGKKGSDIGLLKVNKDFNFANKFIKPVVLNYNYIGGNKTVTAMGFGRSGTPPKTILQELDMMTLTQDHCKQRQYVLPSELCAYSSETQGACYGDSGGPLVLKETNNQVAIGARVEIAACIHGWPDVYTRLDVYQDWILKNLEN